MKVLLLAGLAMTVSAATLQMTGIGLGRTDVAMVTRAGDPRSIYAVEINVVVDGAPYVAYCVDIFTNIWLGTFGDMTGSPADLVNGERAAWLLEHYAGLVNTNADAAALQLALWDVVHDSGDGFDGGAIRLASAEAVLRGAADTLVQDSVGQSSLHATIHYNVNLGDGQRLQTLITSPLGDVPEPQTTAITGLGMAALAAVGKRRAMRERK